MTHTCNLRTWAAEARELLQIWGQLGLHRECLTTLDHMWSKALPLWCGIVNKEDSSPRCATPLRITAFRRRGSPTREEPLPTRAFYCRGPWAAGCSSPTWGHPPHHPSVLAKPLWKHHLTWIFWTKPSLESAESAALPWPSALAQEVFSAPRCPSPPPWLVPWDFRNLDCLIILLWKFCAIFQYFSLS